MYIDMINVRNVTAMLGGKAMKIIRDAVTQSLLQRGFKPVAGPRLFADLPETAVGMCPAQTDTPVPQDNHG